VIATGLYPYHCYLNVLFICTSRIFHIVKYFPVVLIP
jgi:hypothetical protein